ncbi:MAG: peptidylprolyl isomerase [Blastocatellia bacterium]|nr:peptidylprolyl isomerase [Blastocatellia bacterium]
MIQYRASAFLRARRVALAILVALSALSFIACEQSPQSEKSAQSGGPTHKVVIETDLGNIKIELLEAEAPKTAENFRALAESGFYNGLIFHRTVRGFMIQGGDPEGTGRGGRTATGEVLPNEIDRNSPLYQGGYYRRGLVAMANRGTPQTATSQFFIMHGDRPLPPNYTIFGKVIEGQEVVDQIATAPVNGERPVAPVVMKRAFVE